MFFIKALHLKKTKRLSPRNYWYALSFLFGLCFMAGCHGSMKLHPKTGLYTRRIQALQTAQKPKADSMMPAELGAIAVENMKLKYKATDVPAAKSGGGLMQLQR